MTRLPAVGDIVRYANRLSDDRVELSAAIVTRVYAAAPGMVNLRVFAGDGTCFPRPSVWYYDGAAKDAPEGTWTW